MGTFILAAHCILKINSVFIDFESNTCKYEGNSFLIDSVRKS